MEDDMPHTAIDDLATTVEIQSGAVVSKVIYRDETLNVTVFGFDAGEGLTEHTASRTALIEILRGRLALTVDGETYDAGPGFWLRMAVGAPHSLVATEPTLMLLSLLGS
jgi:quercetin dioxygenase-like cupin family protein